MIHSQYINIGRENKFSIYNAGIQNALFIIQLLCAIIMGTKLLPNLYIPIFSTFMCYYNGDKTFIKSIYSKFLLKIIANQVYGNKLSGTTDTKHSYFK